MTQAKREKIESIEEAILKLQNQKKEIIQQEKEKNEKARTRRISKRGAIIESILPESVEFSDEDMKVLLESLLSSGFARNKINELQGKKTAPVKAAPTKTEPVILDDSDEDDIYDDAVGDIGALT